MNILRQDEKEVIDSIENLYKTFSCYTRPSMGIIECLDYGPSEDEVIAFSMPLREIPSEYINRLEFYDISWNSWGNEPETKYLLPRVFELYALEVITSKKASQAHAFGLIVRYKMLDLYVDRGGFVSKWKQEESASIHRFFVAMFKYLVAHPDAIESYVEYMEYIIIVAADMEEFMRIWEGVSGKLKIAQIRCWLSHFVHPATHVCRLHWGCDASAASRAEANLAAVKDRVLTDENILNDIEFFIQEPWCFLALDRA